MAWKQKRREERGVFQVLFSKNLYLSRVWTCVCLCFVAHVWGLEYKGVNSLSLSDSPKWNSGYQALENNTFTH